MLCLATDGGLSVQLPGKLPGGTPVPGDGHQATPAAAQHAPGEPRGPEQPERGREAPLDRAADLQRETALLRRAAAAAAAAAAPAGQKGFGRLLAAQIIGLGTCRH